MPLPIEAQQRIQAALTAKVGASLVCWACGHNTWNVVDGLLSLTLQDQPGVFKLGGPALPTVGIVCTTCGHEVFFNAFALGLQDLFMSGGLATGLGTAAAEATEQDAGHGVKSDG